MFFDMSITKRYFIGIFQKKILQTAFWKTVELSFKFIL